MLGHCCCSLYWMQTMLQAGCQRRGDGHHRTCGLGCARLILLRGCTGSRRLAIRGRLSPDDRWDRRCWRGANRPRCLAPPSQTGSQLRPRNRRRHNDVGRRIIIGNIRREPLANDVGGEQTLNIGKAGQPLRALRSLLLRARMTSPAKASCPKPAAIILSLKL